ncbi:hypothetical protein GAR06_01783 [Micromonospora saelicesensis]|nr:hypothetical protein GAR06_01783 [Micromonospora saelicesensis]
MDAQPSTTETRPCAHCGAPVPQRVGAGRPFRYCRDNDGACQRASRNTRMRHRNAPGLPGQVARTWEAVDRLDQIVETLTESLHAELSPVGVQRQLAQVRAEAATEIAAAQTERDEARDDAETAAADAARAREQAREARAEADDARQRAELAQRQATAADERLPAPLPAAPARLRRPDRLTGSSFPQPGAGPVPNLSWLAPSSCLARAAAPVSGSFPVRSSGGPG